MNGVELIAAERKRQVEEEGWGPEHDDTHDRGELIQAAGCYLYPGNVNSSHVGNSIRWPWKWCWWKPSIASKGGRIRDLVKAGALIAAEIDRLQRLEERGAE